LVKVSCPVVFVIWLSEDSRLPDLTDAIAEDWGGKPFVDMQKGWEYALDKYPEVCSRIMIMGYHMLTQGKIDPNRAVAAGASWGGYAIKYG
jgi:dipeptidyl aminopeptidase/acylaminoacyl peptidase